MSAGLLAQQSPHGAISIACTDCHTTDSWKDLASPMRFSHATTTFPLTGQHSIVGCKQCHTANVFTGTPKSCVSCHAKEYTETLVPNHALGRFSQDCTTCHTFNGWLPSVFQHSKTNYQLVGAHQTVDCVSCHTNNRYAGLASDCFSCHQQVYDQTTSPNHKAARLDHNCLACHTTESWTSSSFDHQKTSFPLLGAHQTTDCAACHKNGVFKGLSADCYSCHQADFSRSTTTNHVSGQFSHECTTCHSRNAWKPATLDHNTTNFPLLGAHRTIDCAACHKNGQYAGLPTDCITCHQADFARSTTANHVTGQFSHDCTTCHTMTVWKPATFDHAKTNFPLLGAHQTTDCAACHKNGVFKGTATDCYTCHLADFSKSTTANHVTGQFSHDCTTCHSMTAWKPATFDHNKTAFALTGAHATTDCLFCHKNAVFNGTPTDCYSCHLTDFTGVVDPNHVSGSFDHNCATCHSTTTWNPATFDHSKVIFPLTGAHVQTACAKCHTGGKFVGLTTDCYTCHLVDYTGAKNPDHAAANYNAAHTCVTCHNTTAWQPWIFGHTSYYPLNSRHSTVKCAQCHFTSGTFTTYSCLTGCHGDAHNKTKSCVSSGCHPNSRSGGN
jgi:hypothetical protein